MYTSCMETYIVPTFTNKSASRNYIAFSLQKQYTTSCCENFGFIIFNDNHRMIQEEHNYDLENSDTMTINQHVLNSPTYSDCSPMF